MGYVEDWKMWVRRDSPVKKPRDLGEEGGHLQVSVVRLMPSPWPFCGAWVWRKM